MQNIYKLADFSDRPGRATVSQTADEALLTAIAAGDKSAMQVLFERHRVRVYRFVLRIVRNPSEAEDIVSDVFLQVWRQAGMFRCQSQVSTWLLVIGRNMALNVLKHRPEPLMEESAAVKLVDPAEDPEGATQTKDRSRFLRRCLMRLPAIERAAIDLVYYHQKSISEISEILGAPEGTIKSRLFTARKRLAAYLRATGIESVGAC
jgi:RNA polymerase sigma-70 factor (ECF subfamily)